MIRELVEHAENKLASIESERRLMASRFLNNDPSVKKYLIGKNDQSLAIIKQINIDGIIDDYAVEGSSWEGVHLVKSGSIPEDAIVVNCSTSISPVSVQQKFRNVYKGFLNFFEISGTSEIIPEPLFVQEMKAEIKFHLKSWEAIYLKLNDEKSKSVFQNIVKFRLTADPSFMNEYSVRIKDQYMEDFLFQEKEIFVDAGGFDGDTTEELCIRFPTYKKVLFFEPSLINLEKAKQRLKNVKNIEYFDIGLSDKKETLYFNQNAGSASSIVLDTHEANVIEINVNKLDNLIDEKVTIIKMDLEGWELKALKGAERIIREYQPKLAIAVYHHSKDFREIFEYIMSIHSNYDVYLRHYTEGWSETIMFFVPEKR